MPMTLLEQKTALKRYGFDDGDPLAVWLNAAYHEFETFSEWPWREVSQTEVIAAGDSMLAIVGNFSKIILLRDLTSGETLDYWDVRRFNREIENFNELGVPQIYTILGLNVVHVWPVPREVFEIYVYALAAYDDMVADTDVPSIPNQYHYSLVQGAASIGLEAENEEDRATVARSKFDAAMVRCTAQYNIRQEGEPTEVQDTQGYFSN